MVSARLADVLDLPSCSDAEVTTSTRKGESTLTNCRLVRICRNASARGDRGLRSTSNGVFLLELSMAMTPSTGTCEIERSASADRIEVSSRSRRIARPSPRTRPTRAPRPMFRMGCGEMATGLSVGPAVTTR